MYKFIDYLTDMWNGLSSGYRKGSAMFFSVIFACVIVGVMALKSSVMSDVSFHAFTASGDITKAQEYALSRAETVRALKFSEVVSTPVSLVAGSNGFYEETVVTNSNMDVTAASGDAVIGSKEVSINIYKGNGADRKFCTSLKLHRIDPSSFDEAFGMVANDSESYSRTKAMSADAFHELVDSKITDDKNYSGTDKTLSARAFKEYLSDRLKAYAKTTESVWHNEGIAVGNGYRGVYVSSDGRVNACNVVYRGKKTNDSNALILVPVQGAGGIWYFDYIKRSDLYKKYLDQLYFTFTIQQSAHQTITVTVNGIEHTETFKIKYGDSWTASITPDTGYRAGTLSAGSGVAKNHVTVSATPAFDLRDLLSIEKYGSSAGVAFAGNVYGQGNTTAAYAAAWNLLANYDSNKSNWTKCVSGGYHGHGISYKRTEYQAFRITYPYEYPGMVITVKWTILDGGNGTVTCDTIKKVNNYHYEVVIAGHGGDKGHYGAGKLTVDMTAPGMQPFHFEDTYWINSD